MHIGGLGSIIIFEDSDYFIVNKPSGISTLEDRSETINMLSLAKNYVHEAQVCHRIDKDTSGILVFAKHQEAYKQLSMQFQNREVIKKYHAYVHGSTQYDGLKVDIPLLMKNQGIVKWDTRSGKDSTTVFKTLKNHRSFSLLECQPISGRRHQIRVHLKYVDHPIVADLMYGGQNLFLSQIKRGYKQKGFAEKPMINRMALHAQSISFLGNSGKKIDAEAPYPKDLKILAKQLDKYAF